MSNTIRLLITFAFLGLNTISYSQKVAVVDIQKVFDGYQKVKEARERLDGSKKIAMEELEIYRDELGKIVNELKDKAGALPGGGMGSAALAPTPAGGASADAVSALENLGFKPAVAARAVAAAQGELGEGAGEGELIRVALKKAAG